MSLVFSSGKLFLILSRSLDATRAGAFHLACWCASRALLPSPGRPVLSRTVSFLAGLRLLLRLGAVRLHVQHGLESPAELTGLYDLESGLQNHAQGIAVPMVIAHTAGRHGDQHILEPGDHLCLSRTCSSIRSVPPGLSTRQISRRPRSGSCTEQKTRVTTTVSNCASGNGRASTGARVSVMGTGAVSRRRLAAASMASSGSTASTRTTRAGS